MDSVAVGVDVSQHEVTIAVTPSGETWTSPTTPEALERTMARIRALTPAVVVLEATGGYEAPVAAAGAAAALPIVIVNPRQVRAFAHALGHTAKTDAIDAQVLAAFGARVQPPIRPLPNAALFVRLKRQSTAPRTSSPN